MKIALTRAQKRLLKIAAWKKGPSNVAGQGAFAGGLVGKGTDVGAAFHRKGSTGVPDEDFSRTSLGGLVNHSDKPNVRLVQKGSSYHFRALRPIKAKEEFLVDYKTFPWEGKRSFGKTAAYERPYSPAEIRKQYPDKAGVLLKDPVHSWRARTGLELVHPEPGAAEQKRIWNNWQQMSDAQKKRSEQKSQQLFGMTNAEHHAKLKTAATTLRLRG